MSRRILLLNYECPPLGGGGGVAALQIAEGFIENGYEVDYLTMTFSDLPKFEVMNGVNVYRVWVPGRTEMPTASLLCQILFPLFAFPKALRLVQKNSYEFINTHFAVPTGPLGIWISKLFKLPNILSIHGGDIYDPTKKTSPHRFWPVKKVVQWVINSSDRIVAQSSNTKENALKFYTPEKDIEVIPLPYERKKFAPKTRKELGLDPKQKYTVSVGRLVKRKGFDDLIKAIALIDDKNVHSLIIGDGPELKNLQNLAQDLNISDKIHFLGFVSTEAKFQYMKVADLYVLSSKHEGFGIVLQEAMQVGLPIVATDHGGQVDLLDKNNGMLVPVGNTEVLSKTISMMIQSDQFCYDSSIYMKKYQSKLIAQKYVNLL